MPQGNGHGLPVKEWSPPPSRTLHPMFSRQSLWKRSSGAACWPLAWALAGAAALPWVVPEGWDGRLPPWAPWLGWALVLGTAPLVRHRRFSGLPLAWVLAWGALGGLRQELLRDRALPVGWCRVEGRVAAPWTLRGERWQGQLEVEAGSHRGARLGLSLPAGGSAPPGPGTPVRLHAEWIPTDPGPPFLGERPLWRARSEGLTRRVHLASAQLLEVLGPPAPSPLLRLQTWARARFEALDLPAGPGKDVWGALALGLPPARDEVFTRFAESGTLHTLVVSGLQITLVIAALEFLLRRFLGRGAGLAALAAGLLYAALVGFSAPVWRGLVMGGAWALGRSTGWQVPPVLTLHGALALWLMGHPSAGAEPGFLLAWWALLGLLWGAEPLAGLLTPLLGPLALPSARALAPWCSTLPLLALFHGGAPLWGAAANLLLVPLVGLLTPVALAYVLIPLPGARLLGAVLGWTATGLLAPFQGLRPLATGWLSPWLLLLLGWLLLAHRWCRFRRTRALAVLLAGATFALVAFRGTGRGVPTLTLEALDVGQGDALLIRQPGGEATLLDAGPSPWAARRIVRTLSRRGVREPLHLLVTHPHGDHAGGWSTLARLWPLASTGLPDMAEASEAWAPWAPAAGSAEPLRRGDGWSRGGAGFSIRWPPKPFLLPDANMVSLVARVRWRDRELWLMGDALAMQEADLLDLGDPGPEPFHRLLKLGHHGSRSSSSEAWLRALHPELALATAGRRNRFGHPHAETLQTLQGLGLAPPLVTGSLRGLRVEAVPEGWRWEAGTGDAGFTPLRSNPRPARPR